MEDAADALKIGFAILVFMIAFTSLFRLGTLARSVSEELITEGDRTTYYTYYESDMSSVDENGNRIVTLEDMIPTIYRYATESYGVTIVSRSGEIITRFDVYTENLCRLGSNATDAEINAVLSEINNWVIAPVNRVSNKSISTLDKSRLLDLFTKIYKQEKNSNHPKTVDCPWNGNNALIAQRIDSDLSGIKVYFSEVNPGTQGGGNENQSLLENHIPCVDGGLISRYKNSKFTEYLITHDTNDFIEDDEGNKYYVDETVGHLGEPVRKEIVYVER